MLGRDFIASLVLHVIVVAVTIFASPLNIKKPRDFGEVIRVGVVSMADITPAKITPAEPEPVPQPPQALRDEPEEVPLKDPTTKPPAEITKPVQKPKPKQERPKQKPPTDETKPGDKSQTGTAEGKIDVQAPSGSGISGLGVDNASFNYPYWFTQAFTKLSQNFRIPVVIDGQVSCDVYFQVIKSGRVIDRKVVTSSGIPQFDQACLAAVERSAPFPPLPREYVDEIIGIYVTFTN
ncbi:MAG: TonB family protein [Candidatus Zixiibacteriota bacterium]